MELIMQSCIPSSVMQERCKPVEKNYSLDQIAQIITGYINQHKQETLSHKEYIHCDLGGVFLPTCAEMHEFLLNSEEDYCFEGISPRYFTSGETTTFSNPPYRLYYEILRKDTLFEFLQLKIVGRGLFQIALMAQTSTTEQDIFETTIELTDTCPEKLLGPITLTTLPSNGSLVLSLKCLTPKGSIYGFRWYGDIHQSKADSGYRIYAIRTFGGRSFVITNIKKIIDRLSITHREILEHTLFIIYDSSEEKSSIKITSQIKNGKIIELKGPNYGGGGNASLLISILLRCKVPLKTISEIILIDDDAQMDVETFIRHDAFITARKKESISTAPVYSRQRPSVIQECGGMWGRFFSPENHKVALNDHDESRLFFPYLIKSQQDISEKHWAKALGEYHSVDFSTFIFISFPYEILKHIGAPLPFFLRNDDVEICLRARESGYKIVVNPNLQAWHDASHNPIGEFYACLHGLIINSCYGGINKTYFIKIFLERLSKITGVKNIILLKAYQKALELFAEGPEWMASDTIYNHYAKVKNVLSITMNKYYKQLPNEVKTCINQEVDIVNLVDITPQAPLKWNIIFQDINKQVYYALGKKDLDIDIETTLENSVKAINIISQNFIKLVQNWKDFITHFNHNEFWDNLHKNGGIEFVGSNSLINKKSISIDSSNNYPLFFYYGKNENIPYNNMTPKQKNKKNCTYEYIDKNIPKNFSSERYLQLNPDIIGSGLTPIEHWIKYGQFENRTY